MKKTPLLNAQLSCTIATLGHNDMLVIGDAGLPIPSNVKRIDLALTRNVPGFVETLKVVLSEMKVDHIILAEETGKVSPQIAQSIQKELDGVPVQFVSHEEFKKITGDAAAVVRTGEFTPYANIILVSGVVF
jgi:D-ribose pyranase